MARGAVTPNQALVWYGAQVIGTSAVIACLPGLILALTYASKLWHHQISKRCNTKPKYLVPIQAIITLYPLTKRHTE